MEVRGGIGLAGGGILATPVSGGTSLAVSAAGVGVAIHGSTVVVLGTVRSAEGISGLVDYMSNRNHNGGGSDNFKTLKSNKDANEYAQSKGYKDAHDLKDSHVGKGNGTKFNIQVNQATGEGRLVNIKDPSIIITIY